MHYANAQKFALQKENRVYVFEFIPPASYEEIDQVLQEFRNEFVKMKEAQLEQQAKQAEQTPPEGAQ